MRTLLDSAGTETRRDLELWIDSAHRRRLIDLERFCACLAVPANRFRPGVALLRAIIASRDTATPIETELETILFATLREGGLPLPTPQCWVRTRKKNRRIDFCYPKSKIAIEVDGWTDHGLRAAFEADRIRGNELEEMGWHVLRFTWLQLKSSPVDIRVTVGIALGLTPVRWRSATGKRITAFGKRRQQQPQ
jgi:very-short-patch-repair endonuclease